MAAAAAFKINPEVREVLRRSTITATTLELPAQLDRALYLEVNKVLVGAGGKWNRGAGVHVFGRDPRELLGLAIETGEAVNLKTKLQAFYTPEPVARRVIEAAEIRRSDMVLEPSAGGGALARLARQAGGSVTCVEIDLHAIVELVAAGFSTLHMDFLRYAGEGFDRIVMNPPFADGQAVDHVAHAFRCLAPAGILSAVVPASFWKVPKRQQSAILLLRGCMEEDEELPADAFAESGTKVRTRLIKLLKA
jgi:hypothetical protein